jgi:hypothetical protein
MRGHVTMNEQFERALNMAREDEAKASGIVTIESVIARAKVYLALLQGGRDNISTEIPKKSIRSSLRQAA